MYGIMTIASGIVGVISGSLLSQKLRPTVPTADALICGFGLLLSSIFFYFCFVFAQEVVTVTYVLVFFGLLFLNLNWALVGDILLVIPMSAIRVEDQYLKIVFIYVSMSSYQRGEYRQNR